jgi:DNA processing protein
MNDSAPSENPHKLPAGVRTITPGDAQWPAAVNDLDTPPTILYVRGAGNLSVLTRGEVTLVIGSRSCTSYGAEVASDLGHDLSASASPSTVLTGAAYGIEACATRGALSADRPAVVVTAGGVDVAYPRAHASLFDRVAQDGLIVSELPPGVTPTKTSFSRRNEILAALANSVVVVEASLQSGAMVTARAAHALGRKVYAVPGPVTSVVSRGTHELIAEATATILPDPSSLP